MRLPPRRTATTALAIVVFAATAGAADLQPRTAAAFDRYVQVIEAQMPARPAFLWIDRGADATRRQAHDALVRGELVVESIDRTDTGISRDVPDGLTHHWIGTVFVPGATVNSALALLQDYDRHASIYAPAVSRSKLLSRDDNRFRMQMRFTMTRVITVVVNTENEALFTRDGPRPRPQPHPQHPRRRSRAPRHAAGARAPGGP